MIQGWNIRMKACAVISQMHTMLSYSLPRRTTKKQPRHAKNRRKRDVFPLNNNALVSVWWDDLIIKSTEAEVPHG